MAISPSYSALRALAAPVLLLLCLSTVSANTSVTATTSTSATPGAAARAAASTSGTGEPLSVVSVAPRTSTDCGARGVRCCGSGDEQEDPCNSGSFCSSGICVACGRSGELCCPGSTCDFTNSCNTNNLCAITCGLPDLPCCPDEQDYSFATEGCREFESRCLSDVCTVCGGVGQPCCNEGLCDNVGSQCNIETGVCGEPTCGVPGLPCCDNSDYSQECEFSATCVDGSCVECGVNGAACCDAIFPDNPGYCNEAYGECTEEGICAGGQPDASAPAPSPEPAAVGPDGPECGFSGQRCCGADDNADSPCSASSFCSAGVCASCGTPGSACCPDSTCFRGECNADNICAVVCGINGLRCCTADDVYDYGLYEESSSYAFGPSPVPAEGPEADTPFSDPFFYECGSILDSGSLCSAGDVCTSCGEEGEQCCKNDRCLGRAECDTATNICTPPTCGREEQPCCDPPEEDFFGIGLTCERQLGCFDGTCASCGFDGQRCCPGSDESFRTDCYGDLAECSAENTCTNALTPGGDCGFGGDPCCEGANCNQGTVCVDEACTSCGFEGDPCCRGDTCDYEADCTDSVCGPPVCGNIGGPCCSADVSSPPCTSGACVDDECVSCGFPGEPCCPTGRQCLGFGGNAECTDGNVCEGDYASAPFPAQPFAVAAGDSGSAPGPLPPPAVDSDGVLSSV